MQLELVSGEQKAAQNDKTHYQKDNPVVEGFSVFDDLLLGADFEMIREGAFYSFDVELRHIVGDERDADSRI